MPDREYTSEYLRVRTSLYNTFFGIIPVQFLFSGKMGSGYLCAIKERIMSLFFKKSENTAEYYNHRGKHIALLTPSLRPGFYSIFPVSDFSCVCILDSRMAIQEILSGGKTTISAWVSGSQKEIE